ncbi:MAG: DUF1223 domain-containing protein [Woeseiaceae bacterium]|nr:DUF1223 domain-containing protein [Woeseiaceae bacterium]
MRSVSFVLIVVLSAAVNAAPLTDTEGTQFSSGEQRVTLLELFTSEGCSSCPPADRWLSQLKNDEGLWRHFVPIAFHVDYWDYIGWPDRFAKADYSARQQRYAREGGTRFVYTPGFFSDGEEWVGWRGNSDIPHSAEPAGALTVRIDGATVAVHYTNPELNDDDPLRVHVAVLGMDLETRVRAGENRGRRLEHDFVALDVSITELESTTAGYRAVATLPADLEPGTSKALVAWVSRQDSQAPLQAVGGFLPDE